MKYKSLSLKENESYRMELSKIHVYLYSEDITQVCQVWFKTNSLKSSTMP